MMEGLELIAKTREYLDYLEQHLLNVRKAWLVVQRTCCHLQFIHDDYIWSRIDRQVAAHDVSKLSKEEFTQYRQRFYPTEDEEEVELGSAWEHHRDNNMHHWETWTKEPATENQVHCVHMAIDWIAMGFAQGDTAREYYESNAERIKLPGWAVTLINQIFDAVYGE